MARYITRNPATGETLEEFAELPASEVESVIERADTAYRAWRERPVAERAAVLARAADLYEERAEQLAQDVTTEMGKPISAARGEMKTVAGIFRYYAEQGPAMLEHERIEVAGGGTAYVRRDPVGVLLGVMPWNFPHYQIARFAAPNLLLGNTMILKHAGICARSALNVEQLLLDAGLPEGAFVNAFIGHEAVAQIVADERVQGVSLTGSDKAGQIIGEQAGRNVKKAVLELGGSDPFIVAGDADVARAAKDAVSGRCVNSGQTCTSSKRFIVVEEHYEQFLSAFVEGMRAVPHGDPTDESTVVGPLSSPEAVQEVHELVQDAVAHGATLHVGGEPGEGPGAYYPPTVLTDVDESARAFREEIFGPVAVVHRVKDLDAAIELANDSPYGLSSSVYTTSAEVAEEVSARLETGMVWVNSTSKSSAELPFGGVKRSGIGRELGTLGIEEFANHKLVRSPEGLIGA
ncbi:NAD-dependent succinate-semialdehyde dehydrogenase [Micrococcus luteus]|nr:NAD-dependent succinate-semialdehyde dehydrogenase [Micrococcus luteus]